MIFLKQLLSSSIIYITIMVIASPMDDQESKIKGVEIDEESEIAVRSVLNNKSSNISDFIFPIHYNMKTMLDNNFLHSVCIITLNISYAKQYISFYVPNETIIMYSKLNQNNGTVIKTNLKNFIKNNTVVLDFGNVSLRGIYDLYIEYAISINIVRESFGTPYINKDENEEWLIATGIQRRNRYQSKKQQIFPYWDRPELRITFNISITHSPKYNALSNMPIRDTKLWKNMTYTNFHETPLISIDTVSFLVSGFRHIILSDNETIRSSIWFRPQSEPHLEFAKTVISSINEFMEHAGVSKELVLTSVSFENKTDHVVIPDLQNEIEQSFGFIFYREADVTYNEELNPVAYKTIIARLIARGMVQKYIRRLFRPTYLWPHTWLNEGFNIFYQAYIINQALPNSRMMDLFVVQVQHELLYLNTYVIINSTIEYNSYPEHYLQTSLSQIKGSIIWHMLAKTFPHIFSRGLIKYWNNQLDDPGATTSRDLWNAMKFVMIELNSTYDIKDTMDSWIMQRCTIVLKVTPNYATAPPSVLVEFDTKLDEKQYYIPVTYTTDSALNFKVTWTNILLTPWHSKIQLHFTYEYEWIILNLQQAGYYRVHYDTANWQKIAQYLNSEKYSNIHVLNRAQIINDAFHFAIEKKLEFSIFWELASYLAQERDYIAWYPMLKAFEILSNIFPFLDLYPEFKGVLRFDFMQNFTSRWNLYDENNITDHTKCLNQELAKWECIINENSCEVKSNRHLEWHLANPEENKLLPGWNRWTYCNGLKAADHCTWNKVLNNYMKGNNKILLECLAYSKNSEILINYLEIITNTVIISQISKSLYNQFHLQLEPTERAYALNANIFLSVLERNTKYMLTSLLNNYKRIRHRKVKEIVTLIVIINNAYSKRQLHEINKFVKEELENSIISITDVERKIETRQSEIDKQINYFRSLFND